MATHSSILVRRSSHGQWILEGYNLQGHRDTTGNLASTGCLGFPGGSDSKESACSAGDPALIPRSGRSRGEGNGHPLQYSCLENSMDRRAWSNTVHGVAEESDMTERLHFHFSLSCIGEGNGNPLQYSCLENPRDGGA